MKNYSNSIKIIASPIRIFKALTEEIPFWWTEMFEGDANKKGDFFTVRFGKSVFKTMCVEELFANSKVVWFVEDSLINIPELNNQKEWINTTIVWEIEEKEKVSILQLTHIGLHPEIECYEICSMGWQQFTDSFKLYVETGVGKPFKLNQ